jgi:monovalent cation:H+ antiporter-2, CPA2 family
MEDTLLINVITLIATGVFAVAILRRFNLSPVIGYLLAGALIGDNGFKIVTSDQTSLLGEFGVVFLLFAIGLELSFERLKVMRRYVFGLGTLQLLITGVFIAATVIIINDNNNAAIIIGGGLALSSTALVIQVLEETRSQSTQVGRIALAILILQDFAVVPLLVIVPLLSGNDPNTSLTSALFIALIKAIIALFGIFIAGRLLLRPLFSLISSSQGSSNELAISITLLVVLTAAWGTEHFGLSLALGAFVAGVLVAETDFRLQAEESIYPFKSLLLGLFFMTVGMKIDVYEIYSHLGTILTISAALIIVKTLIITGLCLLFNFSKGVAFSSGLLLAQGGEFAFILFNLGKANGILEVETANILLLVVTCTMALTPLLALVGRKLAEIIDNKQTITPLQTLEYGTRDLANHAIIAGFGQVGKMVARVLEAEKIHYIAIDVNDDVVKEEAEAGFPVFRGDIAQVETLKALGIDRALGVVLSMNNEVTIKRSLKIINNEDPGLGIIVRLKNLKKSTEFYGLGASVIIPEDYETGLQIGGAVLRTVGINEKEIARIKEQFRAGNYTTPKRDNSSLEVEEND